MRPPRREREPRTSRPSCATLLLHLGKLNDVLLPCYRPPSPSPAVPAATGPDAAGATSTTDPTVVRIGQSLDEFLGIVAELFKNMGRVIEETFQRLGTAPSVSGSGAAPGGFGGDVQSPSSSAPP
ncbi:hypothetical protein JCM8115_002979 [Rhodotorula mucilaginosa]